MTSRHPIFFLLPLLGLVAACSPQEEESVEERFKRTEAAIENTARTLEAETQNAVREAELKLENQAEAVGNRVEPTNSSAGEADGNQAR